MSSQSTASGSRTDRPQTGEEHASGLPSEDNTIWQVALRKYYNELAKGGLKSANVDRDLWKINSPVELLDEIRALQSKNIGSSRAWMSALQRLEPIILSLNDFVIVTAWVLGKHGRVGAVIWGSIRIILNLAQPVMSETLDMLEELRRSLPQFKMSEGMNKSSDLANGLSDIYTEIIMFCAKTITFFRNNPNLGKSRNAWSEFNKEFLKTMANLQNHSRQIDEEAHIIRLKQEAKSIETLEALRQLQIAGSVDDVTLPCHVIPYGLNPRFHGREAELAKLHKLLDPQEKSPGPKIMAIHGLGGVGKTQLALNYAQKSLESFEVILWMSAETQIKMTQALSSFAKYIGLNLSKNDKLDDDAQAAQKVKNWFNALKVGFLIVFDNVDSIDLLLQMWSSNGKGSILITTRSSSIAWKMAANVIHLQSFGRDQGVRTLTTLTGITLFNDEEREAAEAIVDQLGGLPLAIVQISDFIRDRQYSFSEFLPLYRSSAKRIIAKGEPLSEYNYTIGTVWELSLQMLSKDARTLQQLLSFLEPDGIEEELLVKNDERLSEDCFEFLHDELDFGEAVGNLARLSFIQRSSTQRTLSMHRLVQEVVLFALSADDKTLFFDLTIKLLSSSFPNTWRTSWKRTDMQQGHGWASWGQCSKALPHVARLIQIAKQHEMKASIPAHFAELVFRCGSYLWEREQPTTARSFLDFGLSLGVDRDDELCNPAIRLLGHVALDVAQPKAALEAYNETLAARLKLVSANDPVIANVYDSIACALTEMGDIVQAFAILDKAVEIHNANDPSRMARTNAILAMTHLRAGNAEQALKAIQDCWRLQDMTEGKLEKSKYPKHSGDIVLFSRIRYLLGDRKSALELASKSIIMRKSMFGTRGARVADSMYLVAKMLADDQKLASATKLLRDIIEMSQGLIEMRGQRARALWTLARWEAETMNSDDIQKLQQEAREVRDTIEGRETEDVDTDEDFAKLVGYMLW